MGRGVVEDRRSVIWGFWELEMSERRRGWGAPKRGAGGGGGVGLSMAVLVVGGVRMEESRYRRAAGFS